MPESIRDIPSTHMPICGLSERATSHSRCVDMCRLIARCIISRKQRPGLSGGGDGGSPRGYGGSPRGLDGTIASGEVVTAVAVRLAAEGRWQ